MATWNFNYLDYLKPTELRSGYGSTASTIPTTGTPTSMSSAFGDYSSVGLGGVFSKSLELCSYADVFTTQNAPIIAQAEAYNAQVMAQNLSNAQQLANQRAQLLAMGINPDSVLGTGTANTDSTANNQLSQILAQLGLGGTANTASTASDPLSQILAQLGLGGTSNTTSTANNQLNQMLSLLGLGGTTNTASTANSGLSSILSLLGLGGTTATAAKPIDDWWNHTDPYKSSSSDDSDSDDDDDAFWEYIDSKVNQSKQQSQLQSLLSSLGL